MVRYGLTNFLPPQNHFLNLESSNPGIFEPQNGGFIANFEPRPRIPSKEEQKEALIRFVKFQIPWMFGQPLQLPGMALNLFHLAEVKKKKKKNVGLVIFRVVTCVCFLLKCVEYCQLRIRLIYYF